MNTGYHNQHSQQQTTGTDPGWMLICAVFALAIGLVALPWIILGVLVKRVLSRLLQEKQRLLLWVILFFFSAFFIYQRYQGQAFWIYHGRAQHVQTAMVPITSEQVAYRWQKNLRTVRWRRTACPTFGRSLSRRWYRLCTASDS